ncbi:MAG: hypothetical protein A3B44_00055 [Candidatus Levybacteria bacterium RIFCSPLOWO2_01_FULL_38_21]|nr:MAG: hypothetical protein A3B44_00055 [Candidatus Levybacteria bacterium RIFCSPLOWO2_01_FULL_38_21]
MLEVNLPPEFGPKTSGKVRDIWVRNGVRIMVTTDRQSAFDRLICTIPLKGIVLNATSAWWFKKTQDIIPNHVIDVHQNILIARQAAQVIPVEVVWREYMAKSATSTSVYHNYVDKGRRRIHGIDFPDGLLANQRFPMGPILTPSTKADEGHDLELTEYAARELADKIGGLGTWEKVKDASRRLFEKGSRVFSESGLILVDTKYEFGIDENGELMVIDELHTSDSSRIWKADSYQKRFRNGETPESFDKEILRKWLADHGFTGEGPVPVVGPRVIAQMSRAYNIPFFLLTGKIMDNSRSSQEIKDAIVDYFERN